MSLSDVVEWQGLWVAFGNWKRGYTVGDGILLNFLRDPYSVKS